MTETKIYIGLNDAETKEQKYDTERYRSLLKQVCFHYHIPFSVQLTEGGYFHENGDYTEENTLIMTLIDVPEETVTAVARDVCAFFHQESVLVTSGEVRVCYVSETL